jgi:AAA family ATP:ADP antiporter
MAGLGLPANGTERRIALSAFAALFGITAGHTFLETARDAMFLANLSASKLPWVYIAIAAAGLVLAQLQGKAMRGRAQSRGTVAVSLVASAVVTAAFWIAFQRGGTLLLYALYVWSGLFASWITVQLWLLIGRFFNVKQARSLFGLIGAGSVAGAVVGAGGARIVLARTPAASGLLVSAAILVVTVVPVLLLHDSDCVGKDAAKVRVGGSSLLDGLHVIRTQPYVRALLVLMTTCTMALTLADYAFKSAVVAKVPKAQLGAYLGLVYTALNAIALVAQLFVAPMLLRTLGVSRVLWIMPALMALGAGGVAAGGGLYAALGLKGVDGTLRHSLHRTTLELLFVPIADAVRERVKPVVDLLAQRGGQAVVALLILGAVGFFDVHEQGLAAMAAVLILAWFGAVISVRRRYLDNFRETLRAGTLASHASVPELDLEALETLFASLSSSRDREVVAALEILSEQGRQRLVPALILYHPAKDVVLRALELFAASERKDFVSVADRLATHADVEVRAAALRARIAVLPDEEVLRDRLADPAPEIRVVAAAAMLARGWVDEDDALAAVRSAVEAGGESAALALARTIRQEKSPLLGVLLEELASSDDPAVLNEMSRAIADRPDPRFVDVLLPLLGRRAVRSQARAALVAIGQPALRALDALLRDTTKPSALRTHVPRTVCLVDPPEAAAAILLEHLLCETDGHVRYKVLRGLSKLRQRAPGVALDRGVLDVAIDEHLRGAFRLVAWRSGLEREAKARPESETPAFQLLVALLRDKETHTIERLFRLFGLVFPREDFERIYRGLKSRDAKAHASSLELLENLVQPPRRGPMLALVDDPTAERRADAGANFAHPAPKTYDALVTELLEHGGRTIRALATYHAAELDLRVELSPISEEHADVTSLQRVVARRVREIQGGAAHGAR